MHCTDFVASFHISGLPRHVSDGCNGYFLSLFQKHLISGHLVFSKESSGIFTFSDKFTFTRKDFRNKCFFLHSFLYFHLTFLASVSLKTKNPLLDAKDPYLNALRLASDLDSFKMTITIL